MQKLLLVFFLMSTSTCLAQERSTKDSITVFYDSLIYQLKTRYLHAQSTNWEAVEPIREQALQAGSFGESLTYCTALFDTINGEHLNLFSPYGWYKWSKGREYSREEFSDHFLTKFESQPGFEVKVLDNRYGYILMPGMLMIDLPQDSIDLEAQHMYDQIMEVTKAYAIEGWVIDLRFNIGGNVFPMLAALYHLLGDHLVFLSLNKDSSVKEVAMLDGGTVYDNRKKMAAIISHTKADTLVPVALITGILTASSGELVAVSFTGREHVKIIGESTAGMLTGNSLTQLPFDIKLTLTSGYLANRKAQYEPYITPDIAIVRRANFEDLMQDPNVIEAIRFFSSLK